MTPRFAPNRQPCSTNGHIELGGDVYDGDMNEQLLAGVKCRCGHAVLWHRYKTARSVVTRDCRHCECSMFSRPSMSIVERLRIADGLWAIWSLARRWL